jgi:hypothetical protein
MLERALSPGKLVPEPMERPSWQEEHALLGTIGWPVDMAIVIPWNKRLSEVEVRAKEQSTIRNP